jgi:hypothetical protein
MDEDGLLDDKIAEKQILRFAQDDKLLVAALAVLIAGLVGEEVNADADEEGCGPAAAVYVFL